MSNYPYRPNGSLLQRKKDSTQWVLDYMIKTTGRTHAFEIDGRFLPEGVANHEQIYAACYKKAGAMERLARRAEAEGDTLTARDIYHAAAALYHTGQHSIFTDEDPNKAIIHRRLEECYERICAINDYPLERVEIPFEGSYIQCLYHMIPGKPKAPACLFLPGMDMCKETGIDPANNPFIKRGFHVLVIDGPGQGMSNIRGIKITKDSYERAASACIDWLLQRPEVDGDRIASIGFSFGTFMNTRLFARDKRIKAAAGLAACYCTKKRTLADNFEVGGLRSKQVIMYMCGIDDEVEFDKFAKDMHHEDAMPLIDRPFLLTCGEFDPTAPLPDTEYLYDMIPGPKEMWVFEDSYHSGVRENISNLGNVPPTLFVLDWLKKAVNGGIEEGHNIKRFIPKNPGMGSYGHQVPDFGLETRVKLGL